MLAKNKHVLYDDLNLQKTSIKLREARQVNNVVNTPLFAVFTVVLVLETLKTLFLGTATALSRGKLQKFINKEDADWLGGEAVETDHPDTARVFRAQRNNLENLLPFFIAGCLYLLSGASPMVGMGYFVAFFIGRTLHTYAYLGKRAMLRRNTYSLAWLAIIAMCLHAGFVIVRGVL